jgi:hypothetical protein
MDILDRLFRNLNQREMKNRTTSIAALLFLAAIFINSDSANSQVNELWASRYNGTGNSADEVSRMVMDNSGNVYVTGRSRGTGLNNNFDYLTIKYNSSGDTLWVRRYDGMGAGTAIDEARDLVVDNNGFVYVTGFSVNALLYSDFLTIKYDSNGDTVWIRRYSYTNNSNDAAYSLAIDVSGYVYVTGSSDGDYLTLCYDASGVFQWSSKYNGPGNDQDIARKIIYAHGGLFVTGTSRNTFNSSTSVDYATIYYNTSGDSLWVRRYNGPGDNYDEPTAIAAGPSGSIYITGFSRNNSFASSADYLTIKYDLSGDSLWVRRYDSPSNHQDEARDIAIDGSGNVYVTGSSTAVGTFSDYATIKYSSSGEQQWVSCYHGPFNLSNDYAHSIAVDGNGYVYVTGGSVYTSLSTTDIVTIKYNSDGVQQWLISYDGPANSGDAGYQIEVDENDFIYVSGNSTGVGSGSDYVTIKYDKKTGISLNSNETPDKFELYQNYPNPFNPTTVIRFSILKPAIVDLRIFDAIGREIDNPVSGKLNPGSYTYKWNAGNLPSGVYFYRLESDGYNETKKLILEK